MAFSKNNQPANRGRPKGSKNKRSQFSQELTNTAIAKLEEAVSNGESWAIEAVLKRTHPILKAITPDNSIDADFLRLKMKEISEFEERLIELEAAAKIKEGYGLEH